MKKSFTTCLFIVLILNASSCLKEGCEETKSPEINFGVLLGGHVLCVIESLDDEVDVTEEYYNFDFGMEYYKVYCDGTRKGPFITNFKIGENGSLEKQGVSYMSFRMDNTDDYINFTFTIQSKDNNHNVSANYDVYYDMFKQHNGQKAYIDFTIKIKWKDGTPTAESIIATIS